MFFFAKQTLFSNNGMILWQIKIKAKIETVTSILNTGKFIKIVLCISYIDDYGLVWKINSVAIQTYVLTLK